MRCRRLQPRGRDVVTTLPAPCGLADARRCARKRGGAPAIVVLCVSAGVTATSLVSVDQEIEIGRQAQRQVRMHVTELRDPVVVDYVRGVGRRLARVARGPKYPYTVSVADYREINAFALPGGPIWINRGVLHSATDESQVASVLAHEIAHVAQRHAADQLTKAMVAQWGLGLLGAVLGNSGGAGAAQMAGTFLANGIFLKFSRDDEREADRDPGQVEVFFSSHPSPADRIRDLRVEVARSRGGRRDSRQFHTVKARLLKLAPPRAMPR